MLRKLMAPMLVLFALAHPVCAGMNLGGMVKAGKNLVVAATLSDGEVQQLASDAARLTDRANPVAPPDSSQAKRLNRLTQGMKTAEGLKLDIKVYLVQEVNAFAMADGTIRVFSGLMDAMTDDEVRYVIGHEIGHVALGHSRKALQAAYATSAARDAAAASGTGIARLSDSVLGELAEKLVHAQHSQAHENEADQYALRFMKANNYDTKAAVSALRKLEKMFGNQSNLLASHPAPGARANAMEKAL